jgi:hypothetical protein
MNRIHIEVLVVPDRKFPVAQISSNSIMLAEISRENISSAVIQVCNIPNIELDFDLEAYIDALREADKRVIQAIRDVNYGE